MKNGFLSTLNSQPSSSAVGVSPVGIFTPARAREASSANSDDVTSGYATDMFMSTADWTIAFVLPNLPLKKSLDEDSVSIVPSSDPRVQACMQRNPAARQLVNGFTDQFGTRRNVSAMIYRRGVIP